MSLSACRAHAVTASINTGDTIEPALSQYRRYHRRLYHNTGDGIAAPHKAGDGIAGLLGIAASVPALTLANPRPIQV
ncbi:MAG: hypothetical protein IT425_08240 [Pirellulales bacterium]|nr:hypothetical protein [Pirellulales bacterium]